MHQLILAALLCTFFPIAAEANAQTCKQLSAQLSARSQRDVPCFCQRAELARVKVALPKGVALHAVCGLQGTDGRSVNLGRERVDMNRFGATGDSFDGEFYLSGTLALSGSIRVEPGNSGELWFTPSASIAEPNSPFGGQLGQFKIASESDYKKFGVSRDLLSRPCSYAQASVEFKGFRVSLGQTDDTGAYPLEVRVKRVGQYRSCEQR